MRTSLLVLFVAVAGCSGNASPAPAASASTAPSAIPDLASESAAPPATDEGPSESDIATLNQFFDIMRDRTLARIGELSKKTWKTHVGFATDMAMLSPIGMFSDARANPSAYEPVRDKATHLLAAFPQARQRAMKRYERAVDPAVADLMEKRADEVAKLPKASKEDCTEALRKVADDHTLRPVLGPVVTDCVSELTVEQMKCATETISRDEFDKCAAGRAKHQ